MREAKFQEQAQHDREMRSHRKWRLLCSATYCLNFMLLGGIISSLGPLIPIFTVRQGVPETDFGVLFTLRGIGYVLGSLAGGQSDKYMDTHRSMAIATSAMGIMAIIFAQFEGVLALCCISFLLGFSCAVVEVLANTLITQVNIENVDPWMQALHFSFGLGAMISPVFIASFEETTLTQFGVASVLLTCVYLFTHSPSTREKLNHAAPEGDSAQWPEVPRSISNLLCCFFFTYVGIEVGFGGWISTFGILTGSMDERSAAYGASVFWTFITLGRLAGIPLSLRFGTLQQMRVLITGCVAISCFSLLLATAGAYKFIIYFGGIVFGSFMSTLYPLAMSVPNQLRYRIPNETTSNFVFSGAAGEVTVPILMGYLMRWFGANSLFYCSVVCSIVMLLIYRLILEHKRHSELNRDERSIPLQSLNH